MNHLIKDKNKLLEISFFIKIMFFLVIMILAGNKMGYRYTGFCILEGLIILFTVNCIKNKIGHYIVGFLGSLFLGVQVLILIFGRTYLTLVMMTNLDSIEDLSGNSVLYISSAVILVLISALPAKAPELKKKMSSSGILSWVLTTELILVMYIGNEYSPFYAYLDLIHQQKEQMALQKELENIKASAGEFYKSSISNFRNKPDDLAEKPNVVILFTEGLSQNIIDDERAIMPNVADYQSKSLNFDGYFNHTFATYRGLIGQLFSGYQLNNYDSNQFISLQDIFKEEGYNTTFINTEPNNAPFTAYLDRLDFENLEGSAEEANGPANSISDKASYEKLLNLMEEKEQSNQPYLIAMYTLGTHASFDSVDEVYGDGSDAELNKFYNLDYQFGKFMEEFEKSEMSKDTIVIFTTDHCTYADDAFYNSFPDYERVSWEVDEVPFFIYYQGIKAETIDANGRNSLDFAPTLCDYFDISRENYFLGYSLFEIAENNTNYDTIFHQGEDYFSTRGGTVSSLSKAEKKIVKEGITRYYAASRIAR